MTSMIAINNTNDLKKLEQQIYNTRQTLNAYQSQKSSYVSALNTTKKMVSGMNESLKYLTTAHDNLKKTFTISGKTADAGNIEKTKDELNAAIKEVNSMIDTMNKTIKSLTNSVNYYQNELNKLNRKKQLLTVRQ